MAPDVTSSFEAAQVFFGKTWFGKIRSEDAWLSSPTGIAKESKRLMKWWSLYLLSCCGQQRRQDSPFPSGGHSNDVSISQKQDSCHANTLDAPSSR
jgi:hypothetical protein